MQGEAGEERWKALTDEKKSGIFENSGTAYRFPPVCGPPQSAVPKNGLSARLRGNPRGCPYGPGVGGAGPLRYPGRLSQRITGAGRFLHQPGESFRKLPRRQQYRLLKASPEHRGPLAFTALSFRKRGDCVSIWSTQYATKCAVWHCTGLNNQGDKLYSPSLKAPPIPFLARMEYDRREVLDKDGSRVISEAYLLTDYKLSSLDRVQADGQSWTVKAVSPIRDISGRLDHWEAAL